MQYTQHPPSLQLALSSSSCYWRVGAEVERLETHNIIFLFAIRQLQMHPTKIYSKLTMPFVHARTHCVDCTNRKHYQTKHPAFSILSHAFIHFTTCRCRMLPGTRKFEIRPKHPNAQSLRRFSKKTSELPPVAYSEFVHLDGSRLPQNSSDACKR